MKKPDYSQKPGIFIPVFIQLTPLHDAIAHTIAG
jgi:hypothetical protein